MVGQTVLEAVFKTMSDLSATRCGSDQYMEIEMLNTHYFQWV